MTRETLDRRAALKARHRQAILDAARSLVAERGGPDFSVDDLAARADIARRTVFNHFASLDEVLLAVCEEALGVVVDDFLREIAATPVGDGSRASMFEELASAIRGADLPVAIATICRFLGMPQPGGSVPVARPARDAQAVTSGTHDVAKHEKAQRLTQTAFARVSDRMLEEVARRNPGADPLDAELLVGSLMNGVVVIAEHWIARTGAVVDDRSRGVWDELLTRLHDSVRGGYMPAH